MAGHPIEGLMTTAMQSIKDMVDVNTIVGDAVQSPDGTVIIPISRVSFGFAAGGGEYNSCCITEGEDDEEGGGKSGSKYPFAGGSGAGVSIHPVAFMVVGQNQIKLLPVGMNSSVDKILDLVPDLIEKVNETIKKKVSVRKETKNGDSTIKYAKDMEVDS
ncbi:MAG: GerW family sporulation protein [Clostridia bacterium]|nr:GerW family sporulation protein [Clostridia bacterium]